MLKKLLLSLLLFGAFYQTGWAQDWDQIQANLLSENIERQAMATQELESIANQLNDLPEAYLAVLNAVIEGAGFQRIEALVQSLMLNEGVSDAIKVQLLPGITHAESISYPVYQALVTIYLSDQLWEYLHVEDAVLEPYEDEDNILNPVLAGVEVRDLPGGEDPATHIDNLIQDDVPYETRIFSFLHVKRLIAENPDDFFRLIRKEIEGSNNHFIDFFMLMPTRCPTFVSESILDRIAEIEWPREFWTDMPQILAVLGDMDQEGTYLIFRSVIAQKRVPSFLWESYAELMNHPENLESLNTIISEFGGLLRAQPELYDEYQEDIAPVLNQLTNLLINPRPTAGRALRLNPEIELDQETALSSQPHQLAHQISDRILETFNVLHEYPSATQYLIQRFDDLARTLPLLMDAELSVVYIGYNLDTFLRIVRDSLRAYVTSTTSGGGLNAVEVLESHVMELLSDPEFSDERKVAILSNVFGETTERTFSPITINFYRYLQVSIPQMNTPPLSIHSQLIINHSPVIPDGRAVDVLLLEVLSGIEQSREEEGLSINAETAEAVIFQFMQLVFNHLIGESDYVTDFEQRLLQQGVWLAMRLNDSPNIFEQLDEDQKRKLERAIQGVTYQMTSGINDKAHFARAIESDTEADQLIAWIDNAEGRFANDPAAFYRDIFEAGLFLGTQTSTDFQSVLDDLERESGYRMENAQLDRRAHDYVMTEYMILLRHQTDRLPDAIRPSVERLWLDPSTINETLSRRLHEYTERTERLPYRVRYLPRLSGRGR